MNFRLVGGQLVAEVIDGSGSVKTIYLVGKPPNSGTEALKHAEGELPAFVVRGLDGINRPEGEVSVTASASSDHRRHRRYMKHVRQFLLNRSHVSDPR